MTFENIEDNCENNDNNLPNIMMTESSFSNNSRAPSIYNNLPTFQQDYMFFNLIKEHRESFVRLTEIKIYFDYKQYAVHKKDNSLMTSNFSKLYSNK